LIVKKTRDNIVAFHPIVYKLPERIQALIGIMAEKLGILVRKEICDDVRAAFQFCIKVETNRSQLHGIRVYFSLSREQKVEIATVNNTSILG